MNYRNRRPPQHRHSSSQDSRFQRHRGHRSPAPYKSEVYSAFIEKTSIDPFERIRLENPEGPISMRAMDLICPIGKGQRALIVAPPKTGKTTLLQEICRAVAKNHPEIKLYCLLVEERPEEVTDFKRSVPAEVFASSSDHDTEHHIQTANQLLEKALAEVNQAKDVLIVIDSLTRLTRVHNRDARSGKTLSGGVDANALEIPRRFFGAARKLEEGGSLTLVATALVGTGSQMDEYIFQEFKGTGNMEMMLSKKLSELRLFPAIDIPASGTRKEEKLLSENELNVVKKIRSYLGGLNTIDASRKFIETLSKYATNADLLQLLNVS